MDDPAKSPRHVSINHSTLISFSLAIAIGGGMFFAGSFYEKVNRLDGINIEKRLAKIEVTVGLVAKRLGVPPDVLADINGEVSADMSGSDTTRPIRRDRR